MSNVPRRAYRSEFRRSLAAEARKQILNTAVELFMRKGVQVVTIQEIAAEASVSASSIYSLFKSKKGILRELMDASFPQEQFQKLVTAIQEAKSSRERLELSAKIARQMYDAEREFLGLFTEAVAFDTEFQEVERLREERRYERQQETIEMMVSEQALSPQVTPTQARDILWALTGRDIYRLFVIERGWSSDQFETWLAQQLVNLLVCV